MFDVCVSLASPGSMRPSRVRRAGPSAAAALLLVPLALACATPIGVRSVGTREVHEVLTANVLTVGEASADSVQLLNREFLFERHEEAPEEALASLHERFRETGEADFLLTLAELSFLRAQQSESRPHYLASAVYAYAYLISDEPVGVETGLDRRFRLAADLYNLGLSEGLMDEDDEQVVVREGVHPLPFGSLAVALDDPSLHWGAFRLASFVPAVRFDVRGMRNRYRRSGLGAPLIASLEPDANASATERRWIPPRLKVPVTALLRIDDPRRALAEGSLTGSLEVYAADATESVEIGGHRVPLEFEPSAALAYTLEGAPVWDFELSGFFSADVVPFTDSLDTAVESNQGLFMMQPYRPGLIPLVLVHGTASSPARWAEMMNELTAAPAIRRRYQVWFFTYNTGNPIAYSGALLREALQGAVETLDPDDTDAALRNMVVMGHSQGGLLTKLTAIESGDRFWRTISEVPLEQLEITPETAALLRRTMFVEPVPAVRRIVFVSTPHRGSYLAERFLGRVVSYFVTRPAALAENVQDLVTRNADRLALRSLDQVPSSIDNMDPSNPFIQTLASIPVIPRVAAHSIIPVLDEPFEESNDGVVEYRSAHLEGVPERVIFPSGHSTQSHPQTIAEVRRILLEHLEAIAEDETVSNTGELPATMEQDCSTNERGSECEGLR